MRPEDATECEMDLRKMETASSVFYIQARQQGCHAFLEFCGLMNEFISIARATLLAGQDFRTANKHSGAPLMISVYHLQYLHEKLTCIYGEDIIQRLAALDGARAHDGEGDA
jgi:hypothetical protein